MEEKEDRILKEIQEGLENFKKEDRENREYLQKLREDLEVEEMNLKIAKNMHDLKFKDEVISRIEANIFVIKDLITMTQERLDQLEIDREVLILRKKAAEEIF